MQFPRLAEGATSLAVSRTPKNANTDLTEAECIELHDMLALQKWTPWSRSLLNAAIARIEDATHLFILSEAEQDVYNYDSSAFVIGRSGTGKTSCALFKLLGLEESLKNEPVRARQLFVTKVCCVLSGCESGRHQAESCVLYQVLRARHQNPRLLPPPATNAQRVQPLCRRAGTTGREGA